MSILGILLLCYTFWPLTIGIFIAILFLGSGLSIYFGIKIVPYVVTAVLFLIQSFRSSVLEPATMAITSNIRKSFPIELPAMAAASTNRERSPTDEGARGTGCPPPAKAIYSWHPHGLYAISPFIHCCSSLSSWNSPPMSLATHSFISSIPLINMFPIKNKIIPVNEDVMKYELDRNVSISLVPGGVRESFETGKRGFRLVIKKRKGIFRIAIDKQVPIVPILAFGENDLFLPIESAAHDWFQSKLEALTSIQLPIPRWECIRRWFTLLRKPFDQPVRTVVGTPVYPEPDDTVDTLRTRYIEALDALYKEKRPAEWPESIEYLD